MFVDLVPGTLYVLFFKEEKMAPRTIPRTLCLLGLLLSVVIFALLPGASALAATNKAAEAALIGPKSHYLAIGDSLAFGYQPDVNYTHGYSNYFYTDLQQHGATTYDNLGCPGETSATMINGKCPYSILRKYLYVGAQLPAAVKYLKKYAGQVSPVTLDIGANDLLGDIDPSTCAISATWASDLAAVDTNLTKTILPQLSAALTVNGARTGDLLLMNYYDPYQNVCPNSVAYIQEINQHIAIDAVGYGPVVDVFSAFGGATTPNPNICSYTWMCSVFKNIHATSTGYSVMAKAFEQTAGY
jgi:lysophospholipase L1-like esterase